MSSTSALPSPMCTAALQYARRGWPVFPCREKDGEPYTTKKGETKTPEAKAPYTGTGLKDATTDEQVIIGWWKRWPKAMIGLPMGRNGLFAVDFDPRVDEETGEEWTLERLKTELETGWTLKDGTEVPGIGPLPTTLAVRTPSGGVHVYFRQPDGDPVRNRGNLPHHVDVRGMGGYVIAPPSFCEGGARASEGRYRFLHGRMDAEPVDAPEALIEVLRAPKARKTSGAGGGTPPSASHLPPAGRAPIGGDDAAADVVRKYALSALDGECRALAQTPMGDRNNQINARSFSLGQLVGAGALVESVVRAALQQVVAGFGRDYDKCCQAIENGLNAGMAQPRDLSDVIVRARERASRPPRVHGAGLRPPPRDSADPSAPPLTPAAEPGGSPSFRSEASALAAQPEGVRERLLRVAAAWLARRIETVQAPGSDERTPDGVKKLAFSIGLRVGAGLIARSHALAVLDEAFGFLPGLLPSDYEEALGAGALRPFDLDRMLVTMRCATYPMTDKGNAMRFRDRHGADFLYTTAKGWLGWDGRRYRVLDQEKDVTPAEVMAAVFDTVDSIQQEAAFVRATGHAKPPEFEDPEHPTMRERIAWKLYFECNQPAHGMDALIDVKSGKIVTFADQLVKWGRASESSGRLGCIANLAKRWLTVEITSFDTNPMLLNCPNGTLHFVRPKDGQPARVELLPHRREDRLTKLTACDYDPDAAAPEFQKLVRWAQPKAERRRYLRQWAGYNLTGDMGEQIFHIWWGPTAANGKSTVGNVLREAVGDYGDITNVETFLDEGQKKRGDQATPDIVRLPGVRFLTSGEPAKGAKINEALINSVTGGDPMLARDNFRSFFRFSPSFKWTLWCNAKPDIPQGTEGIWRRVKVLLWESHLEPHERDRELPNRLKLEYAGVLAWAVRGLIDWMDNGFVEPEDVRLQSEAYRDDSDPLASFLRMCTEEDPKGRVQSSHLYELFCAWAKAAGETEWKQKGFSRAMKDRGFDNKQSNGMQWLGLKMIRRVSDFVDQDGKVVTIDDDVVAGQPPPAPDPRFDDDHELP